MWILWMVAALAGLPVEDVRWQITVRGPTAEAWVTQTVHNRSDRSVTGVYALPLPHDGAVDALRIEIGETVIEGDVKERVAAREAYEEAAASGVVAGLTTQEPGGEFLQHLANVPAGATAQVALRVRWPIRRVQGGYELVVPTHVAPRFDTPGLPTGPAPQHPVTVDINAQTGFEVTDLHSPTHHDLALTHQGPAFYAADLRIHSGADVVVRWSTPLDRLQAAALGPDDHTVLIIEGPATPQATHVPTEWLFVVDTSGSMSGEPWFQARRTVRTLLDRIHEDDAVGMLTFGNTVQSTGIASGQAGRDRVRALLAQIGPNGSTQLHDAVQQSLEVKGQGGRRRVMVLITDGLVGHDAQTLHALAQSESDTVAAMVMVGDAPNAALVERMATAAGGYLTRALPGESEQPAQRVLTAMSHAACTDLQVDWGGTPVESAMVPHTLFAGRPVVVLAAHDTAPDRVEVRCRLGTSRWSATARRQHALDDGAVRSLFGRARLEAVLQHGWADQEDVAAKGTTIALEYGLLSPWTSLVAIDHAAMAALRDASDGETGTPLTRAFLNTIPSGRSYQSAVGVVSGGNPNMAGGVSNENTYMLDGVNISDTIEATGECVLLVVTPPSPIAPPDRESTTVFQPSTPYSTNNLRTRVGGGGGSSAGALVGMAVSGPLVRDGLWLAAQVDQAEWADVHRRTLAANLAARPSDDTWISASAHGDAITLDEITARDERALVLGTWHPSNRLSLQAAALRHQLRGATSHRTLTLGQAAFAFNARHRFLADVTAGRSDHDGRPVGTAQATARTTLDFEQIELTGDVGITHLGRTLPTVGLAADLLPHDHMSLTVEASQTAPHIVDAPRADALAPITRSGLVEVRYEVVDDAALVVGGTLSDAQTWGRSNDPFAADGPVPVLGDTGGAVHIGLRKPDRRRWSAAIEYRHQRRSPDDPASLFLPGVQHWVGWTDRLRRHHIDAHAAWVLPTDPWTFRLRGELAWMSDVPTLDTDWAASRLYYRLEIAQDLDVRTGAVTVRLGMARGATTGLDLTRSGVGDVIPWTRLPADALNKPRWTLHIEYGF